MEMAASTATVASTSGTNSSAQSSSSKSTSKTTDKSFEQEMKTASKKDEQKTDTKAAEKSEQTSKSENKTTDKASADKDNKMSQTSEFDEFSNLHAEVNFTDYKYGTDRHSILSQNIQSLIDTKDLISSISAAQPVEYDVMSMSESDANFFANLVERTDMSVGSIINAVQAELVENKQGVQKNIQVSSVLMEKLAESLNTNRPFRVDFDKDISVIIKVNRDGSLSANFIPGDKAVEEYLRNNISSLRQRFDDENLPYSQLSYSNSNNRQQKHKKENDNE